MLEYSDIQKYDPTNMHKVYDDWPTIAKNSYHSDLESANFELIDHIVFSGMGGSGTMGDLFLSVLSKTPIHVTVVKGYTLPKTVNSKTLVIGTSVSGNTVETITTIKSAKEIGCKIICFSSGGKLEEFCKANHIQHRHIALYGNPRASFPAFVFSIIKTLKSIIPIEHENILESIAELERLSEKISTKNLSDSNPSLSLAKWMNGIPVIYYPWGFQAVAIRFKNSIQENIKNHAMIEDIIETCHNGIVSWERASNAKPIMIRGTGDYVKTKERWEILKKFFKENNIDYWEINSIEGNILSKIMNLIYLLDFATIYKAILDKVDPFTIKPIDYVKKNL